MNNEACIVFIEDILAGLQLFFLAYVVLYIIHDVYKDRKRNEK